MASKTLALIMEHWIGETPDAEYGWVDLPFNIENFCRENDELIAASTKGEK